VRAALRVGAYQLAFLHTPAHAAVSATVAEVDGPGRRLVNAVLRRVAEGLAAGPLRWPDLATELSYPDWIVELFCADLGAADGRAALVQMDQAASATVRADGYIQDRASQLVAAHVGARAGERVLDLCAAPGGKATALASSGAMVVAVDIDAARATRLAANAAGLGLGGVSVVVADGEHPPLAPASFDRVLVDAPCSGLGVLRRRPDARWRVRPDDLPRLAALQRRLLNSAAGLLRPGGVLVYCVCTMTRVETAGIDRWLARAHCNLVALPPPKAPWRPAGRGAILFPHTEGTDGMFMLTLHATGQSR
jgi:16S rRNA (cytosine967-C5)-methyltransferase